MSAVSRTQRIAELNDRLRTALGICCGVPGMVLTTRGITTLEDDAKVRVLQAVRAYRSFSKDDDPFGEHDFGAFDVIGVGRVFWKIDYYADTSCKFGSEDPSDPDKSFRVLTIMLAEEY